jgi:glycosyltransferase involved in cell wall biosynthesis
MCETTKRLVDVTVCEVVTPWVYPERQFTSRATVSVVIPTLNEALNIAQVLPRLPPGIDQVVLVDGGSADDTVDVARRLRPDITIVQQTRRGKGNALACGVTAATGDIIVFMDADGSTQPAEISRFVEALIQSGADFASGSRFMRGGGSADITSLRRAGSRFLSVIVNVLCRTRYTDPNYGFNAFRRHCLPSLGLDHGSNAATLESSETGPELKQWGDGFEIEMLLHIRVARALLRVVEVPSFERERLYGGSNLNVFVDGLRVLRTILVEWRRNHVSDDEPGVGMATILELHAPYLDREGIRMSGRELEFCPVADRSS